jgi:hypothetical protein
VLWNLPGYLGEENVAVFSALAFSLMLKFTMHEAVQDNDMLLLLVSVKFIRVPVYFHGPVEGRVLRALGGGAH